MDTLSDTINDLGSSDARVRDAAGRALDSTIPLIRPEALFELETRLRGSTCSCYSWVGLKPAWVSSKCWSAAAWAVFSMHPSGYVREAAVRFLSADSSIKFALPFLLLRLNDWVAPVRSAATVGVRALLNAEMLERWTPLLGFIQALRVRTRVDHSQLFDEVTHLFMEPASELTLRAAIASNDRTRARAAIEIALRLHDDRRAPFIAVGLRTDDPEIRRIAGDAVRTWRECPTREDLLKAMFADCYMPVRRLALLARIDEPSEKRRESLIASLLDSHRSMRQLAQYYLSRDEGDSPKLDVRAFYLRAYPNNA